MRSRSTILIIALIGVINVCCYWISASVVSLHDGVALSQYDTLLYCQAARRIVEGHPFSFSLGEAPTTGTTSVLYPFVLAVPYFLGFRGDSLLNAGFFINALFYLLFIYSWTIVFCHWFRKRHVAVLASLLVAFSGQSVFCALAQSDTGMWMCASSLFVAGLATRRRWLWGGILILLPWIRPEGLICLVALFVWLVASLFVKDDSNNWRHVCRDGSFLAAGGISALVLVVANRIIAGAAQFSSVSGKGHFANMPFAEAITATAQDAVTIFSHFFMGLATTPPRCFFVCPVIAGICLLIGIAKGEWRVASRRGFLVCALMAILSIGLVASSGWQGTNCDRYLAWILPVGIALAAEGAFLIASGKTFQCAYSKVRSFIVAGMLLGFGVMSAVVHCMIFVQSSELAERCYSFAKECDPVMPDNASIGVLGFPGVVYGMKERRVAHVYGIYSSEFLSVADEVNVYETLKLEDKSRFDYWFIKEDSCYSHFGLSLEGDMGALLGQTCLVGPDSFALRKADWTLYDESKNLSVDTNSFGSVVARVDVGSLKDEWAHSYSVEDRYNRKNISSLVFSGLAGKRVIEGVRVVVGYDRMKVQVQPGKDVTVVMRTAAKLAKEEFRHGPTTSVSFNNPLRLNIAINGSVVSNCELKLAEQGFTDAVIKIPGQCIKEPCCEVAFLGDHAVGGYWFYQ